MLVAGTEGTLLRGGGQTHSALGFDGALRAIGGEDHPGIRYVVLTELRHRCSSLEARALDKDVTSRRTASRVEGGLAPAESLYIVLAEGHVPRERIEPPDRFDARPRDGVLG